MNFTREPIIETIVSPKDGYKLSIRNSKVSGAEEFFVDAVEVVSFGQSFFFRSQEGSKPFLVPVSDYEILEIKETRVVLKSTAHDRNIKIGGGREASLRSAKESLQPKKEKVIAEEKPPEAEEMEAKSDRKRDRRRSRRRRLSDDKKEAADKEELKEFNEEGEDLDQEKHPVFSEDTDASIVEAIPMSFSRLLPPPPVLISERLNRLKQMEMTEQSVLEEISSESAKSISDESLAADADEPARPSEVIEEVSNDKQPASGKQEIVLEEGLAAEKHLVAEEHSSNGEQEIVLEEGMAAEKNSKIALDNEEDFPF